MERRLFYGLSCYTERGARRRMSVVRWESSAFANGVSEEETIEVTVPEDGVHVRAVFERIHL